MDPNLMQLLAGQQNNHQDIALITVISSGANHGLMMAVDQEGEVLWGSIGTDAIDRQAAETAKNVLNRGLSRYVRISANDINMEIYINSLCTRDSLLIAGAGSMACYVGKYADILGYKITVFDNRPEMLTRARFPEGTELILGDIAANIASYNITADTSIVIASHHHEFDQDILRAVVFSPARYIGMLGNKRKVAAMFEHLRNTGMEDELIAKVHSPIGLNLGGRKTPEIALAIIAEIQAVKYGRKINLVS
jgi:Xanthine and CO dehydrogenases maturation factor, XdhC/CoxF family